MLMSHKVSFFFSLCHFFQSCAGGGGGGEGGVNLSESSGSIEESEDVSSGEAGYLERTVG